MFDFVIFLGHLAAPGFLLVEPDRDAGLRAARAFLGAVFRTSLAFGSTFGPGFFKGAGFSSRAPKLADFKVEGSAELDAGLAGWDLVAVSRPALI